MADLSLPIIYNGWTSGVSQASATAAQSGYIVDRIEYSNVETARYFDKRAVSDGYDAYDVFLGRRGVSIQASVFGSTAGDKWDKLSAFMEAFNPVIAYNNATADLGFQALKFYRPTADISTWPTSSFPNGIPLQIYCRPASPPTYAVIRDEQGGQAGRGGGFRVTATLEAADPRIYLQSSATVSVSTTSQSASNRGNYPAFPIFTFTMTSAGSSAMLVVIDGFSVGLDLSTASTGSFTLDYEARTLVDGNGTARDNLIRTNVNNQFAQIGAAGSVVTGFNLTGMSVTPPTGGPILTYYEAFAG